MRLRSLISRTFSAVLASLLIFALLPLQLATAAGPNLVANPSLETVGSPTSLPRNWQKTTSGVNTTSFQYFSSGAHTGKRMVKTTVKSYTSGESKWMFDAVSVTPNTAYTFSTWYKANVATNLILRVIPTSGAERTITLQTAPIARSNWTQLSSSFTMPADVSKVSVYQAITKVGWVQVDDVSLTANDVVVPVAPNITLTAPTSGSTLSGSTTLSATSTSSLTGVQFQLDGTNLGSEISTAPYNVSWDTTQVTNGSHTLTAVARSTNGLSTTSSPVSVTVNNQSTPVDTENLVANPAVETADPANPAKPQSWLSNAWGTNTPSFSYGSGRTGKGITTSLSSWTSGDAKWYFEPVSVVAGKTYLYRDYYQSTVNQRVVVAMLDASGTYSYKEIDGASATNTWTMYQAHFTIPAGITKVTVFHLIDSVGSLTIDDALLQVYAPSGTTDVIPNGSVETGGTSPSLWQNSKWGTNTPTFSYVTNDGYTGNRSLKVTMNGYTDGDAKWFFDPIKTLTPGQQYRFSVNYKGTVIGHPVAMFLKADGTEQYFGMPVPLNVSASNWQTYSDTFSVPSDAVAVSVFMYVNQNGWLQTDNYTISDYHPTGFNRPLLTLTFDDGHEDNALTALPLLDQYGFKSTQCYATSFIEGNTQAVSDVLAFKNSGHEICSHTVTHPFLTTLDATDLNYELQHAKQYLESIIGQPVPNFATPYGDYNATVNNAIATYYQSHRTVDEGYNSKDNFNTYRLRVQNILDTTSANQVASWIAQAQASNTWLILVYHRVADNPGPYDSYTNIFAQHLAAIQASGITVKTYQDALTEVKSQL